MSWDRRIDFHIDVDAPSARCLLTSETDSSVISSPPELVAGDKLKARFHFYRRGTLPGSIESIDPGADATFRFSGRPQGVPTGSALLFAASSFSQVGTGIWETTVDLHTQELIDHIAATPAGSKTITAEIEVRDAADSTRRSIQFPVRANPQVWDNQDAPTALPNASEWFAFGYPDVETMNVTGELLNGAYEITFVPLMLAGFQGGRPCYTDTAALGTPTEDYEQILFWDHYNSVWKLINHGTNGGEWRSLSDVDDVSTAADWTPQGSSSGTPAIAKTEGSPGYFRAGEDWLAFVSQVMGTARLWSYINLP